MRSSSWIRSIGLATVALVALPGAAVASGGGGDRHDSVRVLLDDLSSPKGLAANRSGNLVVGQGAFGPPGPVVEYVLRGRWRGAVNPLTEPFALVDVAISPIDDTGWAIAFVPDEDDPEAGSSHLFHQLADGTIVDVLDITAYQATDPDPVDHDVPPNPIESNPYGLAVSSEGDALIADAAGNDLLRVTPDGVATTVARFDVEAVATDQVPADLPDLPDPLPPTFDAEAVPTTVAIGPDGAIYVGELKGFPFRPGSSNIWRIEPDADGAWCSVNTMDPTGRCSLFGTGYTAINDIAFDPSTRRLYVYELAADGVFAFEAGLDPAGPGFPPAVLVEVRKPGRRHERRTELAVGALSQPGGVVVVRGKVYVTDSVFTGGRLVRIG